MQISKRKKILLLVMLFVLTITGLAIYKLSSAVSSVNVASSCCSGGINSDVAPTCLCGMG